MRLPPVLLVFFLLACGDHGHVARGVVRDLVPEYGQVIIAHEDIPGLMPAMTMNFDAAPDVLAKLEIGQTIEFTVVFDGKSYLVTEATVIGQGEISGEGGSGLANVPDSRDAAPAFELLDQDGKPVSLEQLRGKLVLVDFIFTHCPGPCPILTSTHRVVQRKLPEELRERTWLVSISLDPERDTPKALREYAEARNVDFSNWSFLTGPVEEVSAVVRRYGVGTVRQPDGNIEHVVVTFLVDPSGKIAERYIGLAHRPEEILEDLARIGARSAPR